MTGPQQTTRNPSDQLTAEPSTETPITQRAGVIDISDARDGANTTETEQHDEPEVNEDNDSAVSCDNCESSNLSKASSDTETICEDCGSIIDTDMFPNSAGWKHESSQTHESTVNVTDNNDAGISMNALGGRIDWKDMDGYGSSLSSKKRAKLHRLRNLDQRLSTSRDETQNYKFALGEMNRLATFLDIPRHVRDAASETYEELLEENKTALTGLPIESVAAAVLYAVCTDKDISRSSAEIAEISHVDEHELVDTYDRLAPVLGMNDHGVNMTERTAELCDDLHIDGDVQHNAMEILTETLTDEFLQTGDLIDYIAAAVYMTSVRHGEVIQQKHIASTAGITHDSLRQAYQQQLEAVSM